MANTLTEHVFVDGSRNLITQMHILADGTGNETLRPILDISNYNNGVNGAVAGQIRVMKIMTHTGAGTTGQLIFGGDPENQVLHNLATNEHAEEDFTDRGGIPSTMVNNWDGKIYLTTQGFDAANDYIEIIFWIKKVYKGSGHTILPTAGTNAEHGFGADGHSKGANPGNDITS